MGYYIQDIFEHNFVAARSSDFWEMNFHHLITVSLYGSMIVTNSILPGAMISFLHNLSDVPGTVTRAFSQTIYKTTTVVTFFVFVSGWVLVRNVMLPIIVHACWVYLIYPPELSQY